MCGSLTLLSALIFLLGHAQAYKLRWCTVSDKEQQKCNNYTTVLRQLGNDSNVEPSCVQAANAIECMKKIQNGGADLITLDGGEIYRAGKTYEMIPVVAESYGGGSPVSYYAVAVVKENGTIKSIKDLKGKKSCHTGAGKTAGWVVPIGTLLSKKYMTQDSSCNPYVSAGKYFDKSCVPNVKLDSIDTTGKNPDNLCALCTNECKAAGTYSGYSGAFKCLVDGVGDVAFVKHTTVRDDVKAPDQASNYLYLCSDGKNGAIGQHINCNLAKVPSHAVMTKKGNANKANYVKILMSASKMYGNDSASGFKLFDSAVYGGKDLLFKDSTMELEDVSSQTYSQFLGQAYLDDLEALDDCTPTAGSVKSTPYFVGSFVFSLVALMLFI